VRPATRAGKRYWKAKACVIVRTILHRIPRSTYYGHWPPMERAISGMKIALHCPSRRELGAPVPLILADGRRKC